MSLSRSFPIDSGFPNAVDLRRLDSGLVAREGVFPDPITTAAAGIAVGSTAWNVQARPFVAALKRGGAPYSLSYGVARLANSAQVNAWEIQPAPASGSRIDLLWVRATDPGEGESTSGSDGPGGAARAVPIFGVTAGTPGGTPATPALPAGALLIATVTTPSGAASIAGSTIVQSYSFAHLVGGVAYYRTTALLLDDTSNKIVGQQGAALDTGIAYEWRDGAWRRLNTTITGTINITGASLTSTGNLGTTAYWGTATISFGQTFAQPPAVTVDVETTAAVAFTQVHSVTTTGLTFRVTRIGAVPGDLAYRWSAVGVLA